MPNRDSETAQACEPEPIAEKDAGLVTINWPALWCLVFFVVGFVVGRLW